MTGPLAVVDYGVNNLGSVFNAFVTLGHRVLLADRPSQLEGAGAVILPGVGSFDRAHEALSERGFLPVLEGAVHEGVPLLGICLGMQVLCMGSEESRADVPGLGVVRGRLKRLSGGMKVPHMGWNRVRPSMAASCLFDGLPEDPYFYFVHSYYLDPVDDPDAVVARCRYGARSLGAVVARGSVLGTQFHPEKSGAVGLRFLDNFARGVRSGAPAWGCA